MSSLTLTRPGDAHTPVLLGMRLQCDDDCYIIPTGLFPKLQVCLQNACGDKTHALRLQTIRLSFHALQLQCADGTEALLELNTNGRISQSLRQYLDIVVWHQYPSEGHRGGCVHVMEQLICLCETQQREQHFGHVVLTKYVLGTAHLVGESGTLVPMQNRVVVCSAADVQTTVDTLCVMTK